MIKDSAYPRPLSPREALERVFERLDDKGIIETRVDVNTPNSDLARQDYSLIPPDPVSMEIGRRLATAMDGNRIPSTWHPVRSLPEINGHPRQEFLINRAAFDKAYHENRYLKFKETRNEMTFRNYLDLLASIRSDMIDSGEMPDAPGRAR